MEVLVIDDGSTDDTPERIKKYGERIRYFGKTKGGQASAFNFGLRRSRGDIIAFLGADDFWLPGKLRRVVEEFAKHPDAGMVYHKMRELNSQQAVFEDGGLPLFSGFFPKNTKHLLSYALSAQSNGAITADPRTIDDSGGRIFVGTDDLSGADRRSAGMFGGLPAPRPKSLL